MRKQIIDNDGFLALADSSTYESFVTENWELDELLNHFVEQMNQGRFLIWRTGYEGGIWNVDFVNDQSSKESFREFNANLKVTNGRLHLTEYADLTMAASYSEHTVPSKHNADLYYELKNGTYSILVRQLFNPEIDDEELENKTNFEIVIKPVGSEISNHFETVQWYE